MHRRDFLTRLAGTAVATRTGAAGWTKMGEPSPVSRPESSVQESGDVDAKLRHISEMLEAYLFEHFFDDDGILYDFIDVKTGKPFTSEYMSMQYIDMFHVPNPVHYWSYEDSMQNSGYLLAALYEKYMATKDTRVIDRMKDIYRSIRKVYELSQGIEQGSFSRPYGGLQNMAKYTEPLGADQAQSLFWGLWLFRQLADEHTKAQIDEMNLKTLEWYRKQDYSYLYYRMSVHGSRGEEMHMSGHSLCYYLPCLLWAHSVSGDTKYYNDYVRLWEEQWFECSGGRMNIAWKHRTNLRWVRDLAAEKNFWHKFHERCIDIDISLFNGTEPPRAFSQSEFDDASSGLWLLAPIAENGLSYEWRGTASKNFRPGLTPEERGWLTEWRSASREQKAELVQLWWRHTETRRENVRKGWFPGEKRNLYRHKAQFIPVAKIKDITMAALYDHRALEYVGKAKTYLAGYDRLGFYTYVIDPGHRLITEKDIEFPSRSMWSAFLALWLIAYWNLQRLGHL